MLTIVVSLNLFVYCCCLLYCCRRWSVFDLCCWSAAGIVYFGLLCSDAAVVIGS